jgi:hypothetical protein
MGLGPGLDLRHGTSECYNSPGKKTLGANNAMKRLETVLVTLMVVGCLVLPARAQQQAPLPPINRRGIPDDWSQRRLIFSEPSSSRVLGEL